jgi:hypothetical protein
MAAACFPKTGQGEHFRVDTDSIEVDARVPREFASCCRVNLAADALGLLYAGKVCSVRLLRCEAGLCLIGALRSWALSDWRAAGLGSLKFCALRSCVLCPIDAL